jgi:hypothetical protein
MCHAKDFSLLYTAQQISAIGLRTAITITLKTTNTKAHNLRTTISTTRKATTTKARKKDRSNMKLSSFNLIVTAVALANRTTSAPVSGPVFLTTISKPVNQLSTNPMWCTLYPIPNDQRCQPKNSTFRTADLAKSQESPPLKLSVDSERKDIHVGEPICNSSAELENTLEEKETVINVRSEERDIEQESSSNIQHLNSLRSRDQKWNYWQWYCSTHWDDPRCNIFYKRSDALNTATRLGHEGTDMQKLKNLKRRDREVELLAMIL